MPDTDNTDSELEKILAFIYSKPKINGKDIEGESVSKTFVKAALTNLIAQEANKATDRLLHEVIEQAIKVDRPMSAGGTWNESLFEAVPVSVLNTYLTKDSDIQNKTNDGGSNGEN